MNFLAASRLVASGLSARITKDAAVMLIFILSLLGVAWYSYSLGWTHHENAVAKEQLKEEREISKQLREAILMNAVITARYEAEKSKQKTIYKTIRQEVPHVTTQYIERPGATTIAVPDWVVTRGFVRLWDNALFGYLPNTTGRIAGAAATTDPLVGAERSQIGAEQILDNHIDNAEQYLACRSQLNALIAWHSGKTPE